MTIVAHRTTHAPLISTVSPASTFPLQRIMSLLQIFTSSATRVQNRIASHFTAEASFQNCVNPPHLSGHPPSVQRSCSGPPKRLLPTSELH